MIRLYQINSHGGEGMSSVSGSQRKSQSDQITKLREEQRQKDAEAAKKRNEEVSRLQKLYNEQIAELKDSYDERLTEVQSRNRESLSERDLDHNQEIKNMQDMYRETMRKKAEDQEAARTAFKTSYESNLEKMKQVNGSQRDNLLGQLNDEISTRDQKHTEQIMEMRDEANQAIRKNKETITGNYEKEKSIMVSAKDMEDEKKAREDRNLKNNFAAQLKAERRQRENDNTRLSSKLMTTTQNLNESYGDRIESHSELLKSELDNTKEKYQTALENKFEQLDNSSEQLRESVNDRLNSQLNSKKSQIETLRGKLNNESMNNARLRTVERTNLIKDYEAKIKLLENEKEEIVDLMKERNSVLLARTNETNQKVVNKIDREGRSKLALKNEQHRAEKMNTEQKHQDEKRHLENITRKRVDSILNITNKDKQVSEKYYKEFVDEIQNYYAVKFQEQRERSELEKVAMRNELSNRTRDIEQKLGKRLEDTVVKYEDTLSKIRENHQSEKNQMERAYGERFKAIEKSKASELQSIEMKYEARLDRNRQAHDEELGRMSERNQAAMQSNYRKKV